MSASGQFLLDRGWEPSIEEPATAGQRNTWAKYWSKGGLRIKTHRALALEGYTAAIPNADFLARWDDETAT